MKCYFQCVMVMFSVLTGAQASSLAFNGTRNLGRASGKLALQSENLSFAAEYLLLWTEWVSVALEWVISQPEGTTLQA
jgi:hypothetical protein